MSGSYDVTTMREPYDVTTNMHYRKLVLDIVTGAVSINKGSDLHRRIFLEPVDPGFRPNLIADLLAFTCEWKRLSIDCFVNGVTKEEAITALEYLAASKKPAEVQKVITILEDIKKGWWYDRPVHKGTPGAQLKTAIEMRTYKLADAPGVQAAHFRQEMRKFNGYDPRLFVRIEEGLTSWVLPGWSRSSPNRSDGDSLAGDFFSRQRGFFACNPGRKGSALARVFYMRIPDMPDPSLHEPPQRGGRSSLPLHGACIELSPVGAGAGDSRIRVSAPLCAAHVHGIATEESATGLPPGVGVGVVGVGVGAVGSEFDRIAAPLCAAPYTRLSPGGFDAQPLYV